MFRGEALLSRKYGRSQQQFCRLSHLLRHLPEKESDRVQCQCCHSEVLNNLVGEGAAG